MSARCIHPSRSECCSPIHDEKKAAAPEGDVVAIPLEKGRYGFGRVLRDPFMAFYDLELPQIPDIEQVVSAPVAFTICLMPIRRQRRGRGTALSLNTSCPVTS